MKSFLISLFTLLSLIGGILIYRARLISFTEELIADVEALPKEEETLLSDPQGYVQDAQQILSRFQERQLFLHLALPFERLESAHEKLLYMKEALDTQAFPDYRAHRALVLEELEILKGFENVNFTNLV